MNLNSNRLFGIYDELTTFLTKLNVYQGKGLSSSHELSIFLQLYNGHSWKRSTGMYSTYIQLINVNVYNHRHNLI